MTQTEKPTKKILMLFCGGTISMHKNEDTGSLDIANGADQFFKLEPRIVEIADIEVKFVDNIDSTDADRTHWEKLITMIEREYQNYDGFVITFGTNTMAYASSALSFAFESIGKPVIFTGAQIPAEVISTDGRNNIVNALRIATMDLAGIFVVFGSKVIVGCRAKKVSESRLDAFDSFQQADFAEISVGIKLNNSDSRYIRNDMLLPHVVNSFDDNVACLTLVPGLTSGALIALIDNGAKGLVLRAYGTGDTPHALFDALAYAQEKEVPVLITTQCPGGATALGLNSVGREALAYGVIQVFDMSMESMTTKLMWLLAQEIPYKKIKDFMQKNLRGEVNSASATVLLGKHLEN